MRMLSAGDVRYIIESLDSAIASLRRVPFAVSVSTEVPEATGRIVAVRQLMLRVALADVEVEQIDTMRHIVPSKPASQLDYTAQEDV